MGGTTWVTVYLVTSGAYSDYTVEAVMSTEAAAQELVDRLNGPEHIAPDGYMLAPDGYLGDHARIEPMILNDPGLAAPSGCFVARRGYVGIETDWEGDADGFDGHYGVVRTVEDGTRAFGKSSEHALRALREYERAVKAGTIVAGPDGHPLIEVPETAAEEPV